MSERNFYTPEEVKTLYGDIVPAYQVAFAGEPWFEISKCADQLQRCAGGLSSVAIGSMCELCRSCPTNPAYEADELVNRLEVLGHTRPTGWYIEQSDNGVSLAAVAWRTSSKVIAREKYNDVPAMEDWLSATLGSAELMWLDEVFANKTIKSRGNLRNFGNFVTGLAEMLDADIVAYRTIEPRMLTAPKRDFGEAANIFIRQDNVPDRRDFVIIELGRSDICAS